MLPDVLIVTSQNCPIMSARIAAIMMAKKSLPQKRQPEPEVLLLAGIRQAGRSKL